MTFYTTGTMSVKLFITAWFFIQIVSCKRRILDPEEPIRDKPYMVYFVMAPQSSTNYTGWMCGGVIVHPYYVLTAASCLHDVKYAYAISGYKKYVPSEDIEADSCTSIIKKRVVYICSHRRFYWNHYVLSWPVAEIGLARVESPFDPRDKNYQHCTYPPKIIPMSFVKPRIGDDAFALGWGHNQFYRPIGDKEDYNMNTLQYSPVQILNMSECMKTFIGHGGGLLEYYSICAKGGGNIDSEGNRLLPTELKYGCIDKLKLKGVPNPNVEIKLPDEHRCDYSSSYYYDARKMFTDETYPKEMMNTRRGGICQNDHGGPLVMWRGGRETVVGIAAMFLVTAHMECQGPFLFLSLHSTNLFIHCYFPDLVPIGQRQNLDGAVMTSGSAFIISAVHNFQQMSIPLFFDDPFTLLEFTKLCAKGAMKLDYNDVLCFGQRRIIKGSEVNRDKRYMVYFLSAEDPDTTYRDWLCVGALISTSHVLTAAACLTDVTKLYVIAGYKKYVNGLDVEKDNCTSKRKKKVVRVCTPRAYQLNYEKVSDWMKIDIGLATVDEPYDFDDKSYRIDCTYTPGSIDINYDPFLQKTDTSAVVMGWGTLKRHRQLDDIQDQNSEYLRYARTRITPIDRCVKYFTNHTGAGDVMREFMICSSSEGFLDIDGKEVKGTIAHTDGCRHRVHSPYLRSKHNVSDEEDNFDWRRSGKLVPQRGPAESESYEDYNHDSSKSRPGFCQNDHGAPLVTWSGSKEYVVGVASACLVEASTLLCLPPYLYTSTYCTGLFLQCVLSGAVDSEVRRRCTEIAKEKGIAIEDHPVTWTEQSQSTDTNKQEPENPPQPKVTEESAYDMRAENYITDDKPIETNTTITTKETAETSTIENNYEDVAKENNNSVEKSKEAERNDTEEDYNPLEMILNLAKEVDIKKPLPEPKALRTGSETGDFDPLAIIEEFGGETDGNIDKSFKEATETAENTTQASTPPTNVYNNTKDINSTVTDKNETNKTKDANEDIKN